MSFPGGLPRLVREQSDEDASRCEQITLRRSSSDSMLERVQYVKVVMFVQLPAITSSTVLTHCGHLEGGHLLAKIFTTVERKTNILAFYL